MSTKIRINCRLATPLQAEELNTVVGTAFRMAYAAQLQSKKVSFCLIIGHWNFSRVYLEELDLANDFIVYFWQARCMFMLLIAYLLTVINQPVYIYHWQWLLLSINPWNFSNWSSKSFPISTWISLWCYNVINDCSRIVSKVIRISKTLFNHSLCWILSIPIFKV